MCAKVVLFANVFTLSCLIASGRERELGGNITRSRVPPNARPFFGGGLPGNFGDLSSIFSIFQCSPFNRTFVQTGVPCMQPNMTALNCQNQSCVCGAVPIPTIPPPSNNGSGQFPPGGLPPIPFPTMPFSVWNCGTTGFPGIITPPGTSSTVAPSTTTTKRSPTDD